MHDDRGEIPIPKLSNRDYSRKGIKNEFGCGNREKNHDVRPNSLKRWSKPQLGSHDMKAIIDHLLVHKWSYAEVALRFKVKTALVQKL